MARWTTFKEAFVVAVRNWRLWVLQWFGNAAIFLSFVWWLRISEAHWWNLVFSLVLIVVTAAAALVLHGGTLNYFQAAHEDRAAKLSPAFSNAFKHALAFFVWAILFGFLLYWIGILDRYDMRFPGYLRSGFPAWLRRMISEGMLYNIYTGFVYLLHWVIVPGLLVPFAMFVVGKGFRGWISFGDWKRIVRRRIYWFVVLLVAFVFGPLAYIATQLGPGSSDRSTLQAELTSLILRMLIAYVLSIFGWLLTCSVLGRLRSSGQPGAQPQ